MHPCSAPVVESASFESGETTHGIETYVSGDGGCRCFLGGRGCANHDSAGVDDDNDDPDSAGDDGNAADDDPSDDHSNPTDEHD